MENQHKGLPSTAYEVLPEGTEYEPYVPAEKSPPEMTAVAVILGMILSVIFGVAMVYVGLKIGMTISASIPSAVMSMGIIRGIFRRKSILENNISHSICSAGESLASGIIFTIPAAFLWASPEFNPLETLTLGKLYLTAVIGGVLGVLMMIPLRRYLIIKEHGNLKYPEGTACAEVLVAGDVGGTPAKTVFSAIGVGAVYKFFQQANKLWLGEVEFNLPFVKNLVVSMESSPILLGVGYIIGLEISSYMLGGGLFAWFILIPLITYFGAGWGLTSPATTAPISTMDAGQIWSAYIRYIGAGAVAAGGIISLIKAMPTIIQSFKMASAQFFASVKSDGKGTGEKVKRTEDDIPITWVVGGSLVLIVLIALTRNISDSFVQGVAGALLVFIFGFFFVTVSSRIVGLVGSSSNPVSGMTIGTLILSCLIFRALGFEGTQGMVTALMVGAFVCIAMCIAGDVSQDLKTGFLLGATPKWLQIGEIIGVCTSAYFILWVLVYLAQHVGFEGKDALPAPQANLMSMVIKGIMQGNLPWNLVIAGIIFSVILELVFKIPALPVAVGLYLPLSLSTPVMVGGVMAWLTGKKYAEEEAKKRIEKGVLCSSGLIAGEALMGILVIALAEWLKTYGKTLEIPWIGASWGLLSVFMFAVVSYYLWWVVTGKLEENGNDNATPAPAESPGESNNK